MKIFRRMNIPFIPIASMCLFLFSPIFSSNKLNPSVGRPFEPNILSCKSYSEIFTLTALFDDQTFIQTQMVITNIGLGNNNAACEILVLRAQAASYRTSKRFAKPCWKYSDVPCPTLAIGSCLLAQDGESTKCVVAIDSSIADISLNRPPKATKLLDTIIVGSASKKFYTNEVLIPWTRLRTTLKIAGSSAKQLMGYGMLEHSRSTGYPKDFSQGYISFYGCQGGTQLVANLHFPKNSESGAIRLSLPDELGPVLGNIVRVFAGNQVTCFFTASARIVTGQPPIKGILEITDFK